MKSINIFMANDMYDKSMYLRENPFPFIFYIQIVRTEKIISVF